MRTSRSAPRPGRTLAIRPGPLPRRVTLAVLGAVTAALLLAMAGTPAAASPHRLQAGGGRPIPVLAYYYIWYNPSSWNRAKVDYPLAGRYSSDDQSVMRQQVALAKQSGITGFLVSWKNTPVLDRRLARLRAVAAAAHFKLGIIFEGRNFHGQPLPLSEVRNGFHYLVTHYGTDQVFNIFGRPLVAWSGTWEFTPAQIGSVTSVYGHRLVLLATEKQPASYQAIGHMFSGDAYYWSSADPLHTPGYAKKLADFSATVHKLGGLWVAPAAPGFDAKLVGGHRVIPRRNGQTLRLEMNAAMTSSPDAIGLISWNEYSENSEVEPSRAYGATALSVVASIEHAKAPTVRDFNSSSPSGFSPGPSQFVILGMLIVLLAGSVAVILRRRGRIT